MDPGRGNGADDENTGSDSESDGWAAEVVGSGRDHRGNGSDDATVARTLPGARLQRSVGLPKAEPEPEADPGSRAGRGAAAIPGTVFQLQRATFPREVAGGARDPTELHVGENSAAGSRAGGAAKEAGIASEAAA